MYTLFDSNSAFEMEFQRCTKEYRQLDMYVAWIGNPQAVVPFEYLNNVKKVSAVVGISFCQTHPDGLKFLMDLNSDLRIANIKKGKSEILFHPKVYIFTSATKKAVFIGSSNFTNHGFYKNFETNVLIEGDMINKDIAKFELDMKRYRGNNFSFVPDINWLNKYRDLYNKRRQKIKEAGLDEETASEENTSNSAAWLAISGWDVYLRKFRSGLTEHVKKFDEGLSEMINYFDIYAENLATPWNINIFKDKDRRKMIGGMNPYAWLGHVAASGNFRRILANGSKQEQLVIINSINAIVKLNTPLNWKNLRKYLDNLVALGPSMKVWGRLLAIVRPDIFCTISSPQVRINIAKTLEIPVKYLNGVEGYIMLLQLIHGSPWFNSKLPDSTKDLEIWKRRVAFLDVVFYN